MLSFMVQSWLQDNEYTEAQVEDTKRYLHPAPYGAVPAYPVYLIQCFSSSLPTSSSSIQTYINEINDHRQTSQGLQICFQLQLLLSLIFSEIGLTELYDAILKEIQKIYKVITFTLISDITLVWNDHTSFTKTIFT